MANIKPEIAASISARILLAIADGATVEAAIDGVLGEGTCAKLINDVYDELRARAEAQGLLKE